MLFSELSSSSEGELMCIMLTIESTIMDMAMGVDETDCRVDAELACLELNFALYLLTGGY